MKGLLIGLGSGLVVAGAAYCLADKFYFKRHYIVTPNVTVAIDWDKCNYTDYDDSLLYWVGSN